jgi:micrococcal nuclease
MNSGIGTGSRHLRSAPAIAAVFSCMAILPAGVDKAHGAGRDALPGPVIARVIEVIDGDSLRAVASIWPGQTVTVSVRIRGIDAPEMRSRCEDERRRAVAARERARQAVGAAPVRLANISGGKYFGRVLADVVTASGDDLAALMLAEELARPYSGKRRSSWCG